MGAHGRVREKWTKISFNITFYFPFISVYLYFFCFVLFACVRSHCTTYFFWRVRRVCARSAVSSSSVLHQIVWFSFRRNLFNCFFPVFTFIINLLAVAFVIVIVCECLLLSSIDRRSFGIFFFLCSDLFRFFLCGKRRSQYVISEITTNVFTVQPIQKRIVFLCCFFFACQHLAWSDLMAAYDSSQTIILLFYF